MVNDKIDKNGRTPNRLVNESSPYLLQHAYNPVDWFPWGEEPFELARAEDKPILLSIGYSSCHWCHVMEGEVFEDLEAAKAINDAFVSIKVDREERPDIDNIYMLVAQIMNHSGGWPLNVIMTPEKKPFFVGTYIAKRSMHGRIGMIDLAGQITRMWKDDRNKLITASDEIVEILGRASKALSSAKAGGSGGSIDDDILKKLYGELSERFDEESGGFGVAPKFPTTQNIQFMLRYWQRFNEPRALHMAEATLSAMRRGGIFDHLGGGFHRYSTDEQWLVPHFEKMLYDQALISIAYIEAFQATGKEEYKTAASRTFEYVLNDLTGENGQFFSGEDADSEGVEGKFYVWKIAELDELLGIEEAGIAKEYFSVDVAGNFFDEATGKRTGENILHIKDGAHNASGVKEDGGVPAEIMEKLLSARAKRVRPAMDDKVLTDWNGLMISALCRGAGAFGDDHFIEAALRAASFIIENMITPDGRLLHCRRLNAGAVEGFADDYAFFIAALIDLYEATFDARYLDIALKLQHVMIEDFWDEAAGGFFFTTAENKDVLVRQKNFYDGALPSGNSIALDNLFRLSRMTDEVGFEETAARLAGLFSSFGAGSALGFIQFINSALPMLGPAYEVVVAGRPGAKDTIAMLKAVRSAFLPDKVLLFRPTVEEAGAKRVSDIAGFLSSMPSLEDRATAYVCRERACTLPTIEIEKMLALLKAR
jgi:hypothetical protein